ncbi:MAG: ANTAR domain-containing response regulator [Eubacteriaceae bacterium]|jgi:AmiR/NasT family two-component response regulator
MAVSVAIVDDNPAVRMDLRQLFSEWQYNVVGEAAEGFGAIELCRRQHPDVVLLDLKMPLLDGLSAAKIIRRENLAEAVFILTAYSDARMIEQARDLDIAGYLTKPFSARTLRPSFEIALANSRRLKEAKTEKQEAFEQLERRKLIERAKGCLMQYRDMTEQEAFETIRSISRGKQLSMKRVAEILLTRYTS